MTYLIPVRFGMKFKRGCNCAFISVQVRLCSKGVWNPFGVSLVVCGRIYRESLKIRTVIIISCDIVTTKFGFSEKDHQKKNFCRTLADKIWLVFWKKHFLKIFQQHGQWW